MRLLREQETEARPPPPRSICSITYEDLHLAEGFYVNAVSTFPMARGSEMLFTRLGHSRQLISTVAVRGKIVTRNPRDESVHELTCRIGSAHEIWDSQASFRKT